MGQLPANHLQIQPVFTICGIDFAGPFLTKEGNQRKFTIKKSSICVFLSFTTHAVHLERTIDLSTSIFL